MAMRRRLPRWTMAAPAMLWWAAFFIVPLGSIVYYSLGVKPADPGAGPVDLSVLSLANYARAMSDVFFTVFRITMRTAGLGTIACALVGFPVAYALARYIQPRWKPVLLFLLVLPFWISFLLRTFAWRIILAPEGVLSHFLQDIGLLAGPLTMLDTNAAVQLGIIYNYLPLMVLPMFVALDRIDPALIQGSMDLGAGPIRTFLSVTLPLALPGVFAAFVLSFIPVFGDYVTPQLIGGPSGVMVGVFIAMQFGASNNVPLGGALAIATMLVATLLACLLVLGTKRIVRAFR
jgi:spermidine/putrescine transport system permease protein